MGASRCPLSPVLGHVPVVGLDLKGTVRAVILPLGAWGFSVMLLTEFMKDIPAEIEEAARLDGVGELRLLWQVVLPLCKPALGVAGVLGFIMVWDQYLLPLITAKDPTDYTVTVALAPPGVRSTAAPLVTAPGDRPAPTALSVSCPRVPVT
ncbi:ABC transporter permease subunit [Streptomyces sp. NPDC054834]